MVDKSAFGLPSSIFFAVEVLVNVGFVANKFSPIGNHFLFALCLPVFFAISIFFFMSFIAKE